MTAKEIANEYYRAYEFEVADKRLYMLWATSPSPETEQYWSNVRQELWKLAGKL